MPVSRQGKALPALLWFHRWLGIATCLIFAVWFASGAVMLFQPFPSLSRTAQLAIEAPVDLTAVAVSPGAAIDHAGAAATVLRLVQRGGNPAYIVETANGIQVIDALSGRRLALLGPITAQAEAKRLFGPGALASSQFEYDQWIVHNRFDQARPFYRLDARDDSGTQIYLSARTGELLQRTTRRERVWNSVGAVLHWIYFTPLRASFTAWDRTVWCLSLVCTLVALAGTVLGIIRMFAARRMRPPLFTFYHRRWLRWHHLLGLGTSVFVLGWIVSGWLSMDHGRLFSRGTATAEQAERFAGCPMAVALHGVDAAVVRSAGQARELSFTSVACTLTMTRYAYDGSVARFDSRGMPIDDPVLRQRLAQAASAAWPGSRSVSIEHIDGKSTLALAEGWPAKTLRMSFGHPSLPDIYVDGDDGQILTVMDRSRTTYSWLYYALHTFNVPGLTTRPTLRRILVLLPLLAGFLFSITGVALGWRRLRRVSGRAPVAAAELG